MIWSGIIILSLFVHSLNIINSFWNVVKTLLSKQFLPFYTMFGLYFYIIISILEKYALWEKALYKDFLFWLITSGLVMFFNMNELKSIKEFRLILVKLISINCVVEFLIDFYNFSLIIELLLVPVVSFISILYIFVDYDKTRIEYVKVSRFLSYILSTVGIIILSYSAYKFFRNYDELFTLSNFKSFLFTPLFTILFLPIIYLTVVYIKYEVIFRNLKNYKFLDKKRKWEICLAFFKYCNIKLQCIDNARNVTLWRKYELKNEVDVDQYIRKIIKTDVRFRNLDTLIT